MYEQLNAQLAEAKVRLSRLAQLKASLIPARERLTKQAHVVKGIEDCLADVEDRIRSLESFTLKSLMSSLARKKEAKLDHLREVMLELMPQVEIGEQMLLEMEAGVKEIEAEIASLGNSEEMYKTLRDQKCAQILAESGEPAAQLHEIAAQINTAKNERQSLRKSIQIAKNLIERLRSMSKASGRAKKKMLKHGGLGAIVGVAANTVHRHAAEGVVHRAGDGLSELARSIENLKLLHGSERDGELARLGVMIGHSHADLGGVNTTASSILDLICQATGLLQSKLDEVESMVASLETKRIELIENA